MPRASGQGIELEYELFGDEQGEPLILIAGLGAQLLFWQEDFCGQLAARGFFVIRFDNRDVGLSTKFDDCGVPDVPAVRDGRAEPCYRLEDMAADAIVVLDAAGVRAAHVVGISLGGYIAQILAIDYPDRVLTMTSMMAGVGGSDNTYGANPHRDDGDEQPASRAEMVERRVREIQWMSSAAYFDHERVRRDVQRAMQRSVSPGGAIRQAAAVHAGESRAAALQEVDVPALVLHGALDPSLPVVNAHRTAQAIPGAKLVIFGDLAHELPPQRWTEIIDLICLHARADERALAVETGQEQ